MISVDIIANTRESVKQCSVDLFDKGGRSFQMPRVIIYESVQLVLFVIADTRGSRANITLTTNPAAP